MWRDGAGREVDLHVITVDGQGNGQFGPHDVYPAAGLQGHGSIGGRVVRCITAQVELDFHLGYDHDEDDHADVLALCDRFDLPLPSHYRRSAPELPAQAVRKPNGQRDDLGRPRG